MPDSPPTHVIACPGCKKTFTVTLDLVIGKRVRCRSCGVAFIVDGGNAFVLEPPPPEPEPPAQPTSPQSLPHDKEPRKPSEVEGLENFLYEMEPNEKLLAQLKVLTDSNVKLVLHIESLDAHVAMLSRSYLSDGYLSAPLFIVAGVMTFVLLAVCAAATPFAGKPTPADVSGVITAVLALWIFFSTLRGKETAVEAHRRRLKFKEYRQYFMDWVNREKNDLT